MTKKHFIALANYIVDQNKYGPERFTSHQLEVGRCAYTDIEVELVDEEGVSQ